MSLMATKLVFVVGDRDLTATGRNFDAGLLCMSHRIYSKNDPKNAGPNKHLRSAAGRQLEVTSVAFDAMEEMVMDCSKDSFL
ncbi:MAG: hypothetical protein WBA73_19345, partial [Devosia sp.]